MYIYLPATYGIQAGYPMYSAMVKLSELANVCVFDDKDLPVEYRQQRDINEKRVKEFSLYVLKNPESYVTGALTGTVDNRADFISLESQFVDGLGVIKIPAEMKLTLADGQHREGGLKEALQMNPALKDESVPITLYFADTIERKQQIFADLNGHSVKPSSSLSITFDHRGDLNTFIKEVLEEVPDFKKKVDMASNSVGARSTKAWPLVSVKKAFTYFLGMTENQFSSEVEKPQVRERVKELLIRFINHLHHLQHFNAMLKNQMDMTELRTDYITSHAVFLEAVFLWGYNLLNHMNDQGKEDWSFMQALSKIDLTKMHDNWIGRCVDFNGKMNKSTFGVKSTAARLCQLTDIPMSEDLQKVETSVAQARDNANAPLNR